MSTSLFQKTSLLLKWYWYRPPPLPTKSPNVCVSPYRTPKWLKTDLLAFSRLHAICNNKQVSIDTHPFLTMASVYTRMQVDHSAWILDGRSPELLY